MNIFLILIIPFLGTTIGSAFVFFLKNSLNYKIEKLLLGFASGVMIAASIWSLLIPAINLNSGFKSWLIPSIGFMVGILFLLALDSLIPHMHLDSKVEGIHTSKIKKTTMLVLAVTIHNIPEGMAVGSMVAGFMNNGTISLYSALSLSLGIAIQNIPEGAIISMPLKAEGSSKFKAFLYGMASGIVEPIFGLVALLLSGVLGHILPYVLSFAAGAMIYVVAEELIPEASLGKHSNLGVLGLSVGFVLMMILDIVLG